ncbi:ODA1/DCC2 family protein, partial [Kipferlia bialata]|eukprot:g12844.t1
MAGFDTEDEEDEDGRGEMYYEDMFRQIADHQDMDFPCDVNAIVDKYLEEEDRHFSLFNYNNELQTEAELAEETLQGLNTELANTTADKKSSDEALQARVAVLEERLGANTATAEAYSEQNRVLERELIDVCSVIESLFDAVGCTPLPE